MRYTCQGAKDRYNGAVANQKIHQGTAGQIRWYLRYKAERQGMQMVLQEEGYTSKTCLICGKWRKSPPQGRVFICTNQNVSNTIIVTE